MSARRVPPFRRRFGSLNAMLLCCGLIISLASLNQTSVSAGLSQSDARELNAANVSQEVSLLRQAYGHLFIGDHDYKGHRVGAMKAIAAACKSLGTDISGDANDHEVQPASDDQLKDAKSLVEQVQRMAQDADQPKVIEHLNKAVAEINTALSIK